MAKVIGRTYSLPADVAVYIQDEAERRRATMASVVEEAVRSKMDMDTVPDWMILSSFRHALGRSTYMVSTTVEWLLHNWETIPEQTRALISKELKEAFKKDTAARANGKSTKYPLGMYCDREEWGKLLEAATVPACFCQACKMPPHQCLCSHED